MDQRQHASRREEADAVSELEAFVAGRLQRPPGLSGSVEAVSAQVLSPKSTRRIERSTGLEIVRAWGHRHGEWSKKTGEWQYTDPERVLHYTSCHDLFPDDFRS